jgi:hypothetical protein
MFCDKKEGPVKNQKNEKVEPRELLDLAEKAASRKNPDEALMHFRECIREYLSRNMPFRAIAVAKKARTTLGPSPKVRNIIIRLYQEAGLLGDARQEFQESASFLKKDLIPLFRSLGEEHFIDFMSVIEMVPVLKGKTVFKQHQKGDDVYVILAGNLEVSRDSKRLGVMNEGDVFGELAFFCKGERTATVRALERSILVRIPSGPLKDFAQRCPKFCLELTNIYSNRLIMKAREDAGIPLQDLTPPNVVATLNFPKGREITLNDCHALSIVKQGIVMIDYDDMILRRKEYLKPGSVIPMGTGRAWANTNVVIMVTGMPQEE